MAHPGRPFGLFRNLNAKIAAIPMMLTVIVIFIGCTLLQKTRCDVCAKRQAIVP